MAQGVHEHAATPVFDYLHKRVDELTRDMAVRLVDGFLYGYARHEVR